MKILHVFDHSVPVSSGYSLRSLAILKNQRALGIDTVQLTGPKQGLDHEHDELIGAFNFQRTKKNSGLMQRIPVLNQLDDIHALRRRLASVISDESPDLLHVHSPCLNGLAALGHGLPVLYEMRASWEDGAVCNGTTTEGSIRYKVSRELETYVLKRANGIVTICDGLRDDVANRGIDSSKITVVPNAVDLDSFLADGPTVSIDSMRESMGLVGCYVIAFFGSYFPWEGLPFLIQAMPTILKSHPKIKLLLVGGGSDESKLRNMVEELGLTNDVLFKNRIPHDEISALYRMVDALVYPRPSMRLTEIVTPLKPLEAMAMGKVVIASDVGGHKELIQDRQTGLLFKAGDLFSFVNLLLSIIDDNELKDRLIKNAYSYVRSERTWSGSVLKYLPIYERLLN